MIEKMSVLRSFHPHRGLMEVVKDVRKKAYLVYSGRVNIVKSEYRKALQQINLHLRHHAGHFCLLATEREVDLAPQLCFSPIQSNYYYI